MNAAQGPAIGMAVTTFFGTVWWLCALRFTKVTALRLGAIIAGALILTLGIVAALEPPAHAPAAAAAADWKTFNIVVNVEWIAILIAVVVLRWIERADLIISAIALIVGLHFIPLAGVFGTWLYDLAAVGMILGAAAGFFWRNADTRRVVTCVTCGATLWLCAVLIFISS